MKGSKFIFIFPFTSLDQYRLSWRGIHCASYEMDVDGGGSEASKVEIDVVGDAIVEETGAVAKKGGARQRRKRAAAEMLPSDGSVPAVPAGPKPTFKPRYELEKLNQRQLVELVLQHQAFWDPAYNQAVGRKDKMTSQREIDWDKYSVRHVALKVAYLGWDFLGLAQQIDTNNTIEGCLADALQRVKLIQSYSTCHWSRAGRTDKGVSALGQVIALHVRSNVKSGVGMVRVGREVKDDAEEFDFVTMLNGALPDEIRVLGWTPVPLEFDARFSAISRTYKYFFVKEDLNIEAMREGITYLLGEHDFRNFCKMDVENVAHFNRRFISGTIAPVASFPPPYNPEIAHPQGKETDEIAQNWSSIWEFTISGSAFLWHQVRYMVAMLFMIGRGLEKPTIIRDLLDMKKFPQKPLFNMASEIPLILYDVGYFGIDFEVNLYAQRKLHQTMLEYWSNRAIKSQMARLVLTSMDNTQVRLNYLDEINGAPSSSIDAEKADSSTSSSNAAAAPASSSSSVIMPTMINPHETPVGENKKQAKKDIKTLYWKSNGDKPETLSWGSIKDQVLPVFHPRYYHAPIESRAVEGAFYPLNSTDFHIFLFSPPSRIDT